MFLADAKFNECNVTIQQGVFAKLLSLPTQIRLKTKKMFNICQPFCSETYLLTSHLKP